MSRAAALAVVALALGACGIPEADADPPVIDSTLVDLLAEVHLADARAALDTTGADPDRLADSLRGVALQAHGLGPAALDARLDALGRDPALARATYDALDARLAAESVGGGPASGPVGE